MKFHDPNGTTGDDTLYGEYNHANVIFGDAGNDYLQGGRKADEIHGDAGNDTIVGYVGADTLYGGSGDDVFLYGGAYQSTAYGGQGIDTIADMEAGDKIDLKALVHYTVAGDPNSAVAMSFADITITDNGDGSFEIIGNTVAGDNSFDLDIHEIGIAPTAANFIFA